MKSKKTIIMFIITLIFILFTMCFFIYAFRQRHIIADDYFKAQELIQSSDYDAAIKILEKLQDYKDGAQLLENVKNEKKYAESLNLLKNGEYLQAIDNFSDIKDFKDSKDKIKEAKYGLALYYYDQKDYGNAKKIFVELDDYLESKFYIAQIDVKTLEQSQNIIYKEACMHFKKSNYESALELFLTISDYKDSKSYIKKCKIQIKRKNSNNNITAGVRTSMAITKKQTVKAIGDNDYNQCEVKEWKNIISIDTYGCLTIGLQDNGKVKVVGKYDDNKIINTQKWNYIMDIAAGERHVVGLKKDNTVIADGHNDDGQCNVDDWKEVIAVDAGWRFTVGLTKDSELLFTGVASEQRKQYLSKKSEWKDVVNIAASGGGGAKYRGAGHTVGLKSDGTVVAVGDNTYGQCNVYGKEWKNIVKVVTGDWYTVGLKKNGEIVITGKNEQGYAYIDQDIFDKCDNVVDIAAGYGQTLCLNRNGTVTAFGFNDDNKRDGTLKWHNLMLPLY